MYTIGVRVGAVDLGSGKRTVGVDEGWSIVLGGYGRDVGGNFDEDGRAVGGQVGSLAILGGMGLSCLRESVGGSVGDLPTEKIFTFDNFLASVSVPITELELVVSFRDFRCSKDSPFGILKQFKDSMTGN